MSVALFTESLHTVLADLLRTGHIGRDVRLARQLADWRERLGTRRYQETAAAFFSTLSPLDQRRLAVGLSLHDGSGRLAA